jgi:diguanylate cyclase (GGDEF)-like protein/PAS domain S-box-containing protein
MATARQEQPHGFVECLLSSDKHQEFNFSLMRALNQASPDGILVVNDEGLVVSLNQKFLEIWKLEDVYASAIGGGDRIEDRPLLDAVLERVSDPAGFLRRVQELYADHQADDHCELPLKDGRTLERYSTVIRAEDASYLGRVWFFRDITPRRRLEEKLRNSEQRFRAAARAAQDAMIALDSHGIVQYWNPAAQRILGYSALQILGKNFHETIAPPGYRHAAAAGLSHFRATGKGLTLSETCEFSARRRDGIEIPIEVSVSPMNINGEWWAIGILRDISLRKQAEERVAWLARNDALTALPNRTSFTDQIREAMAQSARGAGPVAMMYLDLDHFKDINDSLGHAVGDVLLQEVASRLRRAVRSTDKVARLGGDEFALLAAQTTAGGAAALADKIIGAMSFPFFLGDHRVRITTSIGIAVHDVDEDCPDALMGKADLALYRAKAEGRNTFRFFTDNMHFEMRQRITLLADLEQALRTDELFLVYQPEIELQTGAVSALEALVRWQHPQRGTVFPAEFISLAEDNGLMVPLGRWVMRSACQQARRWLEQGIDVPVIAVNVSPMQLRGPGDLCDETAEILRDTGLSPQQLEIELTEATLIDAWQHNTEQLQKLQRLGIRIAIDDFGTGYSSLEYLRRFPGSRIKIAQTFVKDLPQDTDSGAIVRAAIGLGRELGREVIAEGVETPEQVEVLKLWGCQEAQGYRFARPLRPEDVAEFLVRSGRRQATLPGAPWHHAETAATVSTQLAATPEPGCRS